MGENKAASGRGNRALKLVANLGPDGPVDRGMRAIRLASHHRIAFIRGGPDRHVQRDFAQEWDTQPLRLMARAAMAENVRARAALRTLEIAHVLDNAEHRHVDLLEHRKPPPRVDQRE